MQDGRGGRVPVGVKPLMVQLGMFYGGLACKFGAN